MLIHGKIDLGGTHNALIQRCCKRARAGHIQFYTTTFQKNVLEFLKIRFRGWHVPSQNGSLRESFLDLLRDAYVREKHEFFDQTVRLAHLLLLDIYRV